MFLRWPVVASMALLLLCAIPAAAQRSGGAARKSPAELAGDVVRTTQAYRDVLTKALPAYEAAVQEAAAALHERQALHETRSLPASYVEEAQRAWSEAQRDLEDALEAVQEADTIILEALVQQNLARLGPLPRGGYQDTATLARFNGRAPWSLQNVAKLDDAFAAAFNRRLPISSLGQSKAHDRLGLDHRAAIDVAIHPDSVEGQWLMKYLRQADIPFIGVRSSVPGASTGAHVHIGLPSARLVGR